MKICCRSERRNWPTADRGIDSSRAHRNGDVSFGGRSESLNELGATVVTADAFDESSLRDALRQSEADVVINQLTSLPKDPSQIAAAIPGDRKLRLEGGGNLLRAAQAAGVRRYIQQLSGFFLKARAGLAGESDDLVTEASPAVTLSAQMYAELEARLQDAGELECVGFAMDFSMARGRGITPMGPSPIRFDVEKCLSLEKDQESGLGFTLRTRRSPPFWR